MQMLYHSESFVVVKFDVPGTDAQGSAVNRGGYEIVDRLSGREIFLDGLIAEQFKQGVEALADSNPTEEAFDAFIEPYTVLAQHPVVLH